MKLIHRLKRLITSDAHAVVDAWEDPRATLAQALREMESECDALDAKMAALKSELESLGRHRQGWLSQCDALEKDIHFAITEGKDDIAKALLRKSVMLARHIAEAQRRQTDLERDLLAIRADAADKRRRLDEIATRAEAMAVFRRGEQGRFACGSGDDAADSDALSSNEVALAHEVEIEFLKRAKSVRAGGEL